MKRLFKTYTSSPPINIIENTIGIIWEGCILDLKQRFLASTRLFGLEMGLFCNLDRTRLKRFLASTRLFGSEQVLCNLDWTQLIFKQQDFLPALDIDEVSIFFFKSDEIVSVFFLFLSITLVIRNLSSCHYQIVSFFSG